MKIKKQLLLLLSIVFILINNTFVFAEEGQNVPEITAKAYLLMDKDTGRILLSDNETEKMYPASLTKLLTALVALQYIDQDELVVIGTEINNVPWDSSIAGHKVGESILFENLLRGLLIASGNDSATTVAMVVAREVTGNKDISYDEGMKVFADLMNKKAKEVGANSSNFVTPHGYHDENHYTTALDIGLIAREALKNELIAQICSEKIFEGYGAGDKRTVDMITNEYTWDNTNYLLGGRLSNNDYAYKYATGVKTGFTSEAGNCLISSATYDDENLIAVVMFCESPNNWYDSKKLLSYGFDNYSNVTIQMKNENVKDVFIDKPRLDDENVLSLITPTDVTLLLSEEEVNKITKEIIINDEFKSAKQVENNTALKTPITKGTVMGSIRYSLNDNVLYEGDIVAERDVLKRTFSSDLSYIGSVIKSVLCSWLIIPVIAFLSIVIIFGLRTYNIYKIRKNRKKRSQKYRFKSKY